jgi:hypothetical protein
MVRGTVDQGPQLVVGTGKEQLFVSSGCLKKFNEDFAPDAGLFRRKKDGEIEG